MVTVYGLRRRGDCEIRYVGFTRFSPELRLLRHFVHANYRATFRAWLDANRDCLEAVTIREAKGEVEARAMEKAAIAALLVAGHRLLNSDHVPAPLRIDEPAEINSRGFNPLFHGSLASASPKTPARSPLSLVER
jgi:hypothetical protein